MRITIKRATQADIQVEADLEITVLEFKEQISANVALPANEIRLICEGRVWEDTYMLNHYNIAEDKYVHCLRYVPPVQPQALVNSPAARAQAQGNGMESEWMQQMMNSPAVQQMMNNPETMRALLRMNPEMNDLLERQPEMARLLEDPEILQQSLNAMRNPAMMREMMRQADRSMSNLETIPGGMDALRRMHTEFSDPLYEAMHGSGGGASNATPQQYDQSTDGPMNDAPLPNPWAAAGQSNTRASATGESANPAAAPSRAAGGGNVNTMMAQMARMFGPGGMGAPGASGAPAAASASAAGGAPERPPQASPFAFYGGADGMGGAANAFNPPIINFGGMPGGIPPFGGAMGGVPPFGNMGGFRPMGGMMPFGNMSMMGAPAAPVVPQDPGEDEYRLKVKYGTQYHLVICKKNDTVVTFKGTLEPFIQVRRQHIRLVQGGRVWADTDTVESYAPSGLDSEVFALKYVPPGQLDLGPLVPPNPFLPPPESRFASQLSTLADMGFTDRGVCIQTLLSVDGDVNRALDILLAGGS
eukprot:GEMP01007362.1.p1 GENE.GEMP01007362.1~~GEMP01007362.1.p1  ORF type:complete len:558 (+),score=98.32 GEMP01007362.1:83-1675(+)